MADETSVNGGTQPLIPSFDDQITSYDICFCSLHPLSAVSTHVDNPWPFGLELACTLRDWAIQGDGRWPFELVFKRVEGFRGGLECLSDRKNLH